MFFYILNSLNIKTLENEGTYMTNIWTEKSIELANQRNYLDLLYKVYPMSVNERRELTDTAEYEINKHFNEQNSEELVNVLLKQDLFPIKDSYVAYLRRDSSALKRNPKTVNRIAGILYEMGIESVISNATEPKETNRQIGPLFKNWINRGSLGCKITDDYEVFFNSTDDIVYNSSDQKMEEMARTYLGYQHSKGLDFIGKFNNKIVLAEAKFLTDFGGHQNAQFNDAINVLNAPLKESAYQVKTIAILDGVLYIPGRHKMHREITEDFSDDDVILSSLYLRDYLYSL